jgi:hypothetical protein
MSWASSLLLGAAAFFEAKPKGLRSLIGKNVTITYYSDYTHNGERHRGKGSYGAKILDADDCMILTDTGGFAGNGQWINVRELVSIEESRW